MRILQLRLLQTLWSSYEQEDSVRVFTSLSQKNLVDENIELRLKCNEQEQKLARHEEELKSTKMRKPGENWGKPGEALGFAHFSLTKFKCKFRSYPKALKQQSFIRSFSSTNSTLISFLRGCGWQRIWQCIGVITAWNR